MPSFANISLMELGVSIALAVLPVVIWLKLMFDKKGEVRKAIIKAFILGTLSLVPLMIIQYWWLQHPEFNVYQILETSFDEIQIGNAHLGYLALFIGIGIFEEVAKFSMLTHLRWAGVRIRSINEAMRYILVIALGFAFTENIFFFYHISSAREFGNLFSAFAFRSTFTTAAHMVFSGIIGYYYAIGKFGNPILELDRWTGKKHRFIHMIRKTFNLKGHNLFHLQKVLQGLFLAMLLHALFNFTLQLNYIGAAALIVTLGFTVILYLKKKRSTYLVFTEEENARPSTIGKAEENVVIELMGMWMNEGKYQEVIEICDRLGKRDPDNNVVKLFRAKAIDRKKIARVKRAINLLFSEEDYDVEQEELSVFERLKRTQEKEAQFKAGNYNDLTKDDIKEIIVHRATEEKIKSAVRENRHTKGPN